MRQCDKCCKGDMWAKCQRNTDKQLTLWRWEKEGEIEKVAAEFNLRG